mgnify:CR=1 FL=1
MSSLETISSTGNVEVEGFAGDGSETNDMALLAGQLPADALIHIMALLATTGVAFAIALRLTRRRLLK